MNIIWKKLFLIVLKLSTNKKLSQADEWIGEKSMCLKFLLLGFQMPVKCRIGADENISLGKEKSDTKRKSYARKRKYENKIR